MFIDLDILDFEKNIKRKKPVSDCSGSAGLLSRKKAKN
jgi:hypothetical protein